MSTGYPVSHNFSRRGRVYFASKRQITSRFSLLSPRRRVFQPVSYEYTIRHDRPRAVPIHLQQRLNFVKKHVRENLRPPILFDLLLPYRYSLRFTPVGVSGGCDYELTWRFKEGVKLNTRFVEITCGRENELLELFCDDWQMRYLKKKKKTWNVTCKIKEGMLVSFVYFSAFFFSFKISFLQNSMIYFIRILLHDPSKFHFSYLQNFRPPSLPNPILYSLHPLRVSRKHFDILSFYGFLKLFNIISINANFIYNHF